MNTYSETDSDPQKILKSRARALAETKDSEAATGICMDVVEFTLAAEKYAIQSHAVREVAPLEHLATLPGTPPFIAGLTNIHGRIVVVIDLKSFFDLKKNGMADTHQVLVVGNHSIELGLLTDWITGFQSRPEKDMQAALPNFTDFRKEYTKAVFKDGTVLLDPVGILSEPKIRINQVSKE